MTKEHSRERREKEVRAVAKEEGRAVAKEMAAQSFNLSLTAVAFALSSQDRDAHFSAGLLDACRTVCIQNISKKVKASGVLSESVADEIDDIIEDIVNGVAEEIETTIATFQIALLGPNQANRGE